jgi:hypothetical protein
VTPFRQNRKKFSPVTPLGTAYFIHKKDGAAVCAGAGYGYAFSKKSSKNFAKLGFAFINYRQKKFLKKFKLVL